MSDSPFLVAEVGANHHGSLSRAYELIDAAASAGADAVKFQCWSPGTMVLDPKLEYTGPGPWQGQSLAGLYASCFTPWLWFRHLMGHADGCGIELFASAFDRRAVDFLEGLGVKRHKIASFELVDIELIRYAASTGKPLILSTGMASWEDIGEAVKASAGCADLTLLRCVSGYPSKPEEAGLRWMPELAELYSDVDVGLSDHTMTDTTAIAATALGATLIEKHFTLNRAEGGPDSEFSLEPDEFKRMVQAVRETAAACDPETQFGPQGSEKEHVSLRRSLYWSRDLEPGHIISPNDMVTARPALGLKPSWKPKLLGRLLLQTVKAHQPVATEHCIEALYLT